MLGHPNIYYACITIQGKFGEFAIFSRRPRLLLRKLMNGSVSKAEHSCANEYDCQYSALPNTSADLGVLSARAFAGVPVSPLSKVEQICFGYLDPHPMPSRCSLVPTPYVFCGLAAWPRTHFPHAQPERSRPSFFRSALSYALNA